MSVIYLLVTGHLGTPHTANSAERQKKLTILGDGPAKQSEPKQCKFKLEYASSTDLQQFGCVV